MTYLALVVVGLLGSLVVGQAVLVLGFSRVLWRRSGPLLRDEQAPAGLVILCLRGSDPFLLQCLDGLVRQDYPDYDIRIVIDCRDDPAYAVVQSYLGTQGVDNATIEILSAPGHSCSLKCSALVQVAARLPERYAFIAQLDADTVPHASWLRELATALADQDVGAATGNRWYMPARPTVGALVRYTWNAAAVVQMYWYRVAWGGTLAVKTRVLRETDLLDKWGRAFCEDTMLYTVLREIGLRIRFVPTLMMINREACHVGGFFRWVTRQLLTAKLYHPAWPAVVAHGVATSFVPVLALGSAVTAGLTGNHTAAWWATAGLAVYEISLVVLLLPMELAVRRLASQRGEPSSWLTLSGMLKCLAIMPLTQLIYPAALALACLLRATRWRGIDYRVPGPWQVEMQGYQPYACAAAEEGTNSL